MENWSLDNHPILINFRQMMDTLSASKSPRFYYLFLTPPYSMPTPPNDRVSSYLFFTTNQNSDVLTCVGNEKLMLKLDSKNVTSIAGFSTKFSVGISMSTFCTSINGLNFNLIELENDIYNPTRPIHPIYLKVLECYQESDKAIQFLYRTFENVKKIINLLNGIENAIYKIQITPENKDDYVTKMKVSVEQVADEVFACSDTKYLPVGGKMKLNYLIFNAVSVKMHFKLFMAYTEALAVENSNAQRIMHDHVTKSKADKEKMQLAANYLRNILNIKSPCAQIEQVTHFFDAVVASLPGVDVAADDILPAICEAMSLDLGFASHVVSFFTYLADIWPSTGLDERTNYILITCSIAANHLSIPPPKEPEPPKIDTKQTQDTIDMLEDFLSSL